MLNKKTKKSGWADGYIEWSEQGVINISAVFSWQLKKAIQRKKELEERGVRVNLGGPATLNFVDNGEVVIKHNPNATFTSRGCIRSCEFCIVPKTEGPLKELKSWVPRPIVCDNNLLACSKSHFDKTIDSLKPLRGIDFNQGLDIRLLTKHHASRIAELKVSCIRLAWDFTNIEPQFRNAYNLLLEEGIPKYKIRVYVLINFNDTPEDALYRLTTIKSMGSFPFPMRYQPCDTEKKNSYIADNWTHKELVRYMRYWSNLRITSKIPFAEFK